jgi:hypothetical protein
MANVNGPYYGFYVPPAPVGSARDITPVYTETFVPGALNDTRRLIKVPINVCCGGNSFMQVGDMDTGTALVLTLRITDGTTTKVLISASTVGQAGGIARSTLGPTVENAIGFVTDNNNYRLELLIATAATGAQSAALTWGFNMVGYAASGIKS